MKRPSSRKGTKAGQAFAIPPINTAYHHMPSRWRGKPGGAYWISRSVRGSGVIFGFKLLVPGLHPPRLAATFAAETYSLRQCL